MMAYILVSIAALVVAALTLFSGFGLGTLLMPVFALFFPVEVAVATTAVVHLLNNLFKLALMGRHADRGVVIRFAAPGAVTAMVGAWLLISLSDFPTLYQYGIGSREFEVTAAKAVIAFFIVVFAMFELLPRLRKLKFDRRYLVLGGALSGFFGGISGHQGALRSAFLAKSGLESKAFIGTGVVCAVVVDCFRLMVYGIVFSSRHFQMLSDSGGIKLMIVATIAAFIGSFIGTRLMKKITMETIQKLVGFMLLGLAVALGTGLI